MADKNRYPQIPSTVWWGLRSIFQKTPNVTIDERQLSIQLGVQEAAARAYIVELRNVGIITDEGKATPLAQKWRLDDAYADAVSQLIRDTYPQSLIDLAPPEDADRSKIVSWFQREGLGEGAARNKAATYMLLSSSTPNEAPRATVRSAQGGNMLSARATRRQISSVSKSGEDSKRVPARSGNGDQKNSPERNSSEAFPLNVNVQIHISADAGSEQIESTFQAMRRYLYDTPSS